MILYTATELWWFKTVGENKKSVTCKCVSVFVDKFFPLTSHPWLHHSSHCVHNKAKQNEVPIKSNFTRPLEYAYADDDVPFKQYCNLLSLTVPPHSPPPKVKNTQAFFAIQGQGTEGVGGSVSGLPW
uniref:Uncharacterized protein n=1 Tax=Anguilla anguilla TaxID=7936 RepID=A0A0E9WPI1_ANGAN